MHCNDQKKKNSAPPPPKKNSQWKDGQNIYIYKNMRAIFSRYDWWKTPTLRTLQWAARNTGQICGLTGIWISSGCVSTPESLNSTPTWFSVHCSVSVDHDDQLVPVDDAFIHTNSPLPSNNGPARKDGVNAKTIQNQSNQRRKCQFSSSYTHFMLDVCNFYPCLNSFN